MKRGGGTCIYVNNRLSYQENSQVLYNSKDLEMQGITLKGNGLHAQKHMDIFTVYRPPGGDDNIAKNVIIEKVQLVTEGSNSEVIILGDLNWDCLMGNKSINDLCDELNLKQIIEHPTRITFNKTSLIDVILTNIKNLAYNGCININVSNHLPVFIIKKRLAKPFELEIIKKRMFKNYDTDILGDNLVELDWSVLDLLNDVNIAWSMLYKGLLVEVEKLCPYKEFRVRKNKPIWFTGELSSLGRERNITLRNYRRGARQTTFCIMN